MIHISDPVINYITFGSDDASKAAFQYMLHEVRAEGQPLGSIDFNKLIPMPEELDIESSGRTGTGLQLYRRFLKECALVSIATLQATPEQRSEAVFAHLKKWGLKEKANPELWALGKKAHENIQKYGCPTWYEWRKQNWGTPRNASECARPDGRSDIMAFITEGAAVPKLAQALSRKFPKQKIAYSWTDNDPQANVGRVVFQGGEAIEIDIPPGCEARAMSAGVWRFQADMERPARHARDRQKKDSHRRPER